MTECVLFLEKYPTRIVLATQACEGKVNHFVIWIMTQPLHYTLTTSALCCIIQIQVTAQPIFHGYVRTVILVSRTRVLHFRKLTSSLAGIEMTSIK